MAFDSDSGDTTSAASDHLLAQSASRPYEPPQSLTALNNNDSDMDADAEGEDADGDPDYTYEGDVGVPNEVYTAPGSSRISSKVTSHLPFHSK